MRVNGEFLFLARRRLKLTQEELAKLCGISVGILKKLEADKIQESRRTTIHKLADGLTKAGRPTVWHELLVKEDLDAIRLVPSEGAQPA